MTPRNPNRRIVARPLTNGRSIVVGLGRTGLSVARYLLARGENFAVTDNRSAPPEAAALSQLAPDILARFGTFDETLLDDASQIIVSPGVSLREPFLVKAAQRGIPILGDIELFVREAKAPIAAITGTNGKSTVTTMVASMATAQRRRAYAGGNIGRPALDLLGETIPHLYVLELSSFQLETTSSMRTIASTVLNVTPDHMDRYQTIEEYAAAKERIFQGCDNAIVNMDDAIVRGMNTSSARVVGFSLEADRGADYYVQMEDEDPILMHGRERLVAMSQLRIAGLHNAANALAALAMGEALGIPRRDCLRELRDFPGLPHRSQWIADINDVRFIDDSKGTNVGATLAAVAGLPGSLVVIAGGQGKGQDFTPLVEAFRDNVRHVVLIGQDAKQLDAVLQGVVPTQFAKDMDEAVQMAANAARPSETVLLSPACASLDMFRDYNHRGEVFAEAVRGLRK